MELETGNILGKHQGTGFIRLDSERDWDLVVALVCYQKDINRNIIYVSKGYDTKHQYGDTINLQDLSL